MTALQQYTSKRHKEGLYRHRQVFDCSEQWINFSSNDYLSLTTDPLIKKAYLQGFRDYPSGSGGSMLVCGYHPNHKALEKAFSEALEVEDCVLFPSGYAANLSVIGLLAQLDAHIVLDKFSHASIYDGLTLSRAHYSRYQHNNLADLQVKIQQPPASKIIVTEGIFSMSGQMAPLKDMAQLGIDLVVDEAHAFGVLGKQGLGAVVQHQLTQEEVPLRVIPLGKSFAATGAIVAGQSAWIEALLQAARPYIYSTAISPAFAYGLIETLHVIRGADDRRQKLRELVQYFRKSVEHSPLVWRDSSTPIQQLQLGNSHLALRVADKLREQSISCMAMRPPTVRQQETGLRVILNHHHQPEHIDKLFACLHSINSSD